MNAAFPDTANYLLSQVPEILRRWDQRVRAEIPAARNQQCLILQNNLELLLIEVAQALAPTGEPAALLAGLTLSQDHGSHRAELSEYSIGEMFLEYRLLRKTILDVLDEKQSLVPEARELVNDSLERAMQDAVSQFTWVHHNAERAVAEEARQATVELRAAYERERRIAQILQRPLLLKVAEDAVAGLSLATFYEPARAEAEVGGDFFDVVPLAGGAVALVVGDTCGKGLEAAVRNTHVKDVLRAFLRESAWHPGAILARLNNVVCDALDGQGADQKYRFVALSLLILETGTGDAFYSSAGAEPLLVVRADGAPEIFERPGLPLGIQRDVFYEDTSLHLEPGDAAVMVTDGITEARHNNESFGYPAMVQLATQALRAQTLQESGEEILSGARTFAHGGLSDDACVILARRR